MWSQFSRLTGSVPRELPPGLRQAASGPQVAVLHHTSLTASEHLYTTVFPLSKNIHLHTLKASFLLTLVARGGSL